MKRLVLFALLFVLASAAAADPLQLRVNNGLLIRADGATAAYTLDASIADATLRDGSVTLFGKSAGSTKLVLVTAAGERIVDLVVTPATSVTAAATAAAAPRRAAVETRYSSGAAQVTNTVEVVTPQSSLHATNVRYLDERHGSLSDAFPAISWQFTNERRKLTFFDQRVENSPLTLNNATVRGAHLEQGGWQLHAGYTAAAFYDGVILPAERESVAGLSYSRQIAPAWRLRPSVYTYPSRHLSDSSHRGVVASLLVAYTPSDRLHVISELGLSRGAGAALQLTSITDRDRLRADVRWMPREFAIAGPSTIRGLISDLAWSHRAGRLTTDATFSANDYLLPGFEQRSVSSSVDFRYSLAQSMAVLAGARYNAFEGRVPETARVDNLVIPAGIAIDFAHFGGTAVARFGRHSNDGTMRGFRVTGRASAGAFSASAYVDRQDDAPTLQLIFQQRPDLALALERLGFEASTPDDIARILRDNASLFSSGIITSASVNLTPQRDQAGLELAWTDSSSARQRLRLRIFANRLESVGTTSNSTLAMLSYSRRLAGATDIETSLARFTPGRTSVEVALRHSFGDLPRLGGGEISGTVTVDASASGIADVAVQLDTNRTVKTDRRGRYSFSGVGRGPHEVIARLPRPDVYFTTPSRVSAAAGDVVDFGLALASGRISGRVVSDAGLGVAGVRLAIDAAGHRFTAVSDSDGNFAVAGPSGLWTAEMDMGSIPPGYSSGDLHDLRLTAIRTITGRVIGGDGAVVELQPLGRRVVADAEGRFAFRSLPAGTFTLVARVGGHTLTRTITVPAQPATISDVELTLRPESARVFAPRTVGGDGGSHK